MKMNSPGAKFKKMLAVCLAAALLFAVGSIAVYKQSASHSTEVLSKWALAAKRSDRYKPS